MLLVPLLICAAQAGGGSASGPTDYTEMSLEELMGVEVTSVARKEQALYDTAAAVYVITRDDIRRSGATAIPEVLRMAPGVQVARISANSWAVAVRGFNNRFTNKLLVMIDGRSIYTNVFSGVYWESIGLSLDVIDRIEVIRGPGGTMWGANAVNGVINIITRSARDTQGTSLSLVAGNEDRLFGTAIYGGAFRDGAWRVHVNGGVRDSGEALGGGDGRDDWGGYGGGFRADWGDPEGDAFLVTADAFDARAHRAFSLLDPTVPAPIDVDEEFDMPGASVLGRWTRSLEGGELSLQGYVDFKRIRSSVLEDDRTTFDVDFQHRLRAGDRHELVWGLGSRVVAGDVHGGGPGIDFTDGDRTDVLFSAFAQDEIRLTDDVQLIAGTKVEHNDLSGFEVQPNVRGLVHLSEKSTAWAAVSRAVRTPSLIEKELVLPTDVVPGAPPVVTVLTGSENFQSEELLAYEVGYRAQPTDELYVDATAFYFDYDKLGTFEPGAPIVGPVVVQPILFDNKAKGTATGFELAADLRVTPGWRLRGSASLFDLDVDPGSSLDPTAKVDETTFPGYTASLLSYLDVSDDLELDLALYAVDSLDLAGVGPYVRVDARVAWRPRDGLELALGAHQLTDSAQQEFGSDVFSTAALIERSIYAGVSWRP